MDHPAIPGLEAKEIDGLQVLRLRAAIDSGSRRRTAGRSGGRRHGDLKKHGDRIATAANELSLKHAQRTRTLGVDPALILVFELGASVDADEFRRSGLRVVDSSDSRITVAFADDPELVAFHERLEAMQGPIPEGQKTEPFAPFFDAIDEIRQFGPEDRLTDEARTTASTVDPKETVRLDIECWHPGTRDLSSQWLDQLKTAVANGGGRVTSTLVNDSSGLILARVYLAAGRIRDLAELDIIARIDRLPTPALPTPKLFNLSASSLADIHPPRMGAPIVGLVDSGVASAHELLAGSIIAAEAIGTGIADGQDAHGHGTMVASLILHGDVEQAIARGTPLRPLCQIVSARVLDANNEFREEDLWEADLATAIEWCAEQGATVINLSLGNARAPFLPPRQLPAAAMVDDLARKLDLVVVAATGNSRPVDYLPSLDEDAIGNYPASLLTHAETKIIDPGTALLALTVGGVTLARAAGGQSGSETPARRPMGLPGWPSPITRAGPGPGDCIKPELVDHAGTLGVEDGRLVGNDAELGVKGARSSVGRLLSWDIGTSYAAPIVTRAAAAIRARFPEFSSELVRALLLLSANRLPFADNLEGPRSQRVGAELSLVGFGRPSIQRATESTSHRAVLVAEGRIPHDGVHVYEIPFPSTFAVSGGERGIEIALAFSPRTRLHRLDYAASRMEFHLVRGLSVDEIRETFARLEGQELDLERNRGVATDNDHAEEPAEGTATSGDTGKPPTVSDLGASVVRLEPPTSVRSRSANQRGQRVFKQRLDAAGNEPLSLVVRNVNRWGDPHEDEKYAVAVALWRDRDRPELHAELEAALEAVAEVKLTAELQAEV